MALSDSEQQLIEHMTLVFRNELNLAMKDVVQATARHSQTLYGAKGERDHVQELVDFKTTINAKTGLIATLAATGISALVWIGEHLLKR